MRSDISISGSGGQGVLLIGRLIAETAINEGWEVVWLPSYGAEKRGGNVACSVAISREKIGALFLARPDVAIALSQPAMTKLENAVKPGGILVVNTSVVTSSVSREDVRAVKIPVNDLAAKVGNAMVGNVIVLGALMATFHPVTIAGVKTTMAGMLANNEKLLKLNNSAFDAGYAWGLKN